jgi:hypothetical protein
LLRDPQSGTPGSGARLDCRAPLSTISNPTIRNVICHNLYAKIDQLLKASDDPQTEYGNIKIQEVIDNIIDWISPTETSFGASNKDAWYEQQNPPYKAKRGPFFTLDELKLVKDVSPTLFLKLQPIVTVYSEDGRIDIDQATQNQTLRTYFPDLNPEAEKRLYNEFALRKGSWNGIQSFFKELEKQDSYSFGRYNQPLQNQAFTSRSYNFIIRSQGIIKKSGSEIQRNMVLQVALEAGSGGCSLRSDITDMNKCTQNAGLFTYVDGKCYQLPTTIDECNTCKSLPVPLGNLISNDKCAIFASPATFNVTIGATAPTGPPDPKTAKIYSWVES